VYSDVKLASTSLEGEHQARNSPPSHPQASSGGLVLAPHWGEGSLPVMKQPQQPKQTVQHPN